MTASTPPIMATVASPAAVRRRAPRIARNRARATAWALCACACGSTGWPNGAGTARAGAGAAEAAENARTTLPEARGASTGPARGAVMREADGHFRRGVELYDDADMSGALAEFSRAYALVPNYKVLYNLGQVAYQQRDYFQALEHFRRYLLEGGAALPRPRRDQVEDDIQRLERRIGHIEILTEHIDDGSDVLLDDVKVATAPVADPLLANVGQRKLELVRPTGMRSVRLVEVTGGEMAHVQFARPVPGLPASARAGVDGSPTTASRASELLSGGAGASGRARDGFPALGTPAWLSWAATAALGAGAATTGILALSASRDLQQRRDTFPLAPGDLDGPAGRARGLALTTDGLLAGTLVMAAVSLYLTFERPAGSAASDAADASTYSPTCAARGGTDHAQVQAAELGHWVSQYP
jgi:hypothetical protein